MAACMTSAADQARATLEAWRASGADRLDPVRFAFIDALQRRAAGHTGQARRLLDERLSALLAAYADGLPQAADTLASRDTPASDSTVRSDTGRPLAGLLDAIAACGAAQRSPDYPELALLDYFRETWAALSAEQQLRQSLDHVPANAGPLNSSSLVHRSLALMREVSPGYLRHFLSYVDALAWLGQLGGDGAVPGNDTPSAKPVDNPAGRKTKRAAKSR